MTVADRERWHAKNASARRLPGVRRGWGACRPSAAGRAQLVRAMALQTPVRCGMRGSHRDRDFHGWIWRSTKAAERRGVEIEWVAADLDDWTPDRAAFDLAIVF